MSFTNSNWAPRASGSILILQSPYCVAAVCFLCRPAHRPGAIVSGKHLGRFEDHLCVVGFFSFATDLNVLLSGARDQKLLRLWVAEEAQHRILFHQFVQARPQLVFIGRLLGSIAKVIAGPAVLRADIEWAQTCRPAYRR